MNRFADPVHALADTIASIDGKLKAFRDELDPCTTSETGSALGYISEAEEVIDRLRARGWSIQKIGPSDG